MDACTVNWVNSAWFHCMHTHIYTIAIILFTTTMKCPTICDCSACDLMLPDPYSEICSMTSCYILIITVCMQIAMQIHAGKISQRNNDWRDGEFDVQGYMLYLHSGCSHSDVDSDSGAWWWRCIVTVMLIKALVLDRFHCLISKLQNECNSTSYNSWIYRPHAACILRFQILRTICPWSHVSNRLEEVPINPKAIATC